MCFLLRDETPPNERTDGRTVGRFRVENKKRTCKSHCVTAARRNESRGERERTREDERSSLREANEQTDGRTIERGKHKRINRSARGFSGRLRGCSSLAGPLVAPRGSERFPHHRRATARRERQSGCARSLAFFDPPSRPPVLPHFLPPLSSIHREGIYIYIHIPRLRTRSVYIYIYRAI